MLRSCATRATLRGSPRSFVALGHQGWSCSKSFYPLGVFRPFHGHRHDREFARPELALHWLVTLIASEATAAGSQLCGLMSGAAGPGTASRRAGRLLDLRPEQQQTP